MRRGRGPEGVTLSACERQSMHACCAVHLCVCVCICGFEVFFARLRHAPVSLFWHFTSFLQWISVAGNILPFSFKSLPPVYTSYVYVCACVSYKLLQKGMHVHVSFMYVKLIWNFPSFSFLRQQPEKLQPSRMFVIMCQSFTTLFIYFCCLPSCVVSVGKVNWNYRIVWPKTCSSCLVVCLFACDCFSFAFDSFWFNWHWLCNSCSMYSLMCIQSFTWPLSAHSRAIHVIQ